MLKLMVNYIRLQLHSTTTIYLKLEFLPEAILHRVLEPGIRFKQLLPSTSIFSCYVGFSNSSIQLPRFRSCSPWNLNIWR